MENRHLNTNGQNESKGLLLKAYSNKELAAIYEVDVKTFRAWLVPFKEKIGQQIGIYYNIKQVRIIIELLGMPNQYIGD